MKHYFTRLQTILSIMLITLFIPSELKSQNDTEYEKLLREYLMENDLKTNFELEAYTAIAKDKINSSEDFCKMLEKDKAPTNLPIPEGCPESYQQQFLKFFKKSPFITTINNLTTQLGAMDKSENSRLKKLMDFLSDNMQAIVLNAYYPTITEKDLQVLYELFSTPKYEKIAVATSNITSDFQQIKQNINLKYSQWLEKQLPPFARFR